MSELGSDPQFETKRQPPNTAFVVFDIGKNVHAMAVYAGYELQVQVKPEYLRANEAGFARATSVIDSVLSGGYERIVIGHEPTGIYHEAWARALMLRYREALKAGRLDYRFLNPYLTKERRRSLSGRGRKTDFLDLEAIAHCLKDGAGVSAYLPSPKDLPFVQWSGAHYQQVRERRKSTVRILAMIDRLWPGALVDVEKFKKAHPKLEVPEPLVKSSPLERKLIRALIQYCPDPHRIRTMSEIEIMALVREHTGRCGRATAARILRCAQAALLPPTEIVTVLAQRLQVDFKHYLMIESRLDELENEADELVPGSSAAVLTSVPGIGSCLAVRYVAGVGDIKRFASAGEVWSFAGFDPKISESSDTKRAGPISKKGDPAFRDALYTIGVHTSRACKAIGEARDRALKNGKTPVEAIVHAAHKANRLCWHLLHHQEDYDPNRHH